MKTLNVVDCGEKLGTVKVSGKMGTNEILTRVSVVIGRASIGGLALEPTAWGNINVVDTTVGAGLVLGTLETAGVEW